MKIIHGNSLEILKTLDTESIDCIITSPPYWQLRDYNVSGQIGLEGSVKEYIDNLMSIMDELYRILKKSGTFFLNMGDTYSNVNSKYYPTLNNKFGDSSKCKTISRKTTIQKKSKIMVPERLCIKMIDKGWILRNEIIWHKTNVLPESLNDRFTNDFEKIFFFTKNQKYYFQKQYEPYSDKTLKPWRATYNENGRNMRTVWSIATKGIKEAHFATFPEELVKRCLLAGCPEGGIVLDPFLGSGTTLKVAKNLDLNGIGIELKKEYIDIAVSRIGEDLFTKIQVI